MAFFEIKVELSRVARALERIADILERHIPPVRKIDIKPSGVEDLIQFDPEAQWQREQVEERETEAGVTPGSRRR